LEKPCYSHASKRGILLAFKKREISQTEAERGIEKSGTEKGWLGRDLQEEIPMRLHS